MKALTDRIGLASQKRIAKPRVDTLPESQIHILFLGGGSGLYRRPPVSQDLEACEEVLGGLGRSWEDLGAVSWVVLGRS